ncbi:hypothetical protein LCGC14_1427820, partial [marine sediment metagenome]
MARTVTTLTAILQMNNTRFKKGLSGSQRALKHFQRQVKMVGASLGALFGVALIGRGFREITGIMIDFDAAMADVRAISQATNKQFELLRDNAKRLGETTLFTAVQVAGLEKVYAKLGFSTKEILEVSKATIQLATAVGADLAQAAEVAGATLRALGLATSQTQRVVDVMGASFTQSALDIVRYAESMKFVAPAARAANIS